MDYTTKTWNSLCSLRDAIERDKVETVKQFDGFELITNKATYRLCFGVLTILKK